MIHERLGILIKQHELDVNFDASPGREAAAVGVVSDLLPEDTVVAPPGDIIPFFIKDLPLMDLLRELVSPSHPAPSVVDQLKTAIQAAKLNKRSSNRRIAVAISNDSTAPGPWQQAQASAYLHGLPMIFVSWNHISLKTKGKQLPTITVDGNDVVAVYRVACEAIAHARIGNGPTLIECQPYGLNLNDPILNMEKYLIRKGILREKLKTEVAVNFTKELEEAILQCSI
jgi:TPP-dependent pyruvate/acetoin dehydrogenase alpha subunit